MDICFKKIISSGQCGAEQGALAAAMIKDCPTGGSTPKGYRTAHGPKESLKVFNLIQLENDKFPPAVSSNIKNSDGTVLFLGDRANLTKPELFVREQCIQYNKPIFNIAIDAPVTTSNLIEFVKKNRIEVLHVTGKIDKSDDKRVFQFVFNFTKNFLIDLIQKAKGERSTKTFLTTSGISR